MTIGRIQQRMNKDAGERRASGVLSLRKYVAGRGI